MPDSDADEIRAKVDIVKLVRIYAPGLRPAGRGFKAICPFSKVCPFHEERTPSFHVNPERQIFHCFGCRSSGDAIGFLMRMEELSFGQAVARLAAWPSFRAGGGG